MKYGSTLPVTILLVVILLVSPMYLVSSQSPINNSFELINNGVRSTIIIETEHFEVHFDEGKEFYARMIGDLAESVYVESIEFANFTPQEKIPIYIVESNDFDGIMLNRGGYEGINIAFQSEWSLDWVSENHMKSVVAHELNHHLLSRKMNNTYVHNLLPIWYCEGLAEYVSYQYMGPERETSNKMTLKYYCEEDVLESLDEMKYVSISSFNPKVYSEGYSVFKFIEQLYGIEEVMLFQENSEINLDTQEGFQLTFNLTQEEFEIDWVDWIITNYTKDVIIEPTMYGHPITDTNDYDVSKREPTSWCKDKILFVSDKYADFDIYVMNDNGTDIQQLTDNNGIIDTDPTWSPDGRKILFTSNRGANFGVYTMNADGTNVISVVDDQYVNFAGTWSPDGESILFISSRSGNYDIYSIGIDGSGMTQLTTDIGSDGNPIYSPDGNSIAFVSNRTGTYELFQMNNDGTEVEKLSSFDNEFKFIANLKYSPDGKNIMFQLSESMWKLQIFSIDLTTLEPEVLIEPLSNNSYMNINNPVWSENGNEIIFSNGVEFYRYEVFEISENDTDYFVPAIVIISIGIIIVSGVIISRKRKSLPPS